MRRRDLSIGKSLNITVLILTVAGITGVASADTLEYSQDDFEDKDYTENPVWQASGVSVVDSSAYSGGSSLEMKTGGAIYRNINYGFQDGDSFSIWAKPGVDDDYTVYFGVQNSGPGTNNQGNDDSIVFQFARYDSGSANIKTYDGDGTQIYNSGGFYSAISSDKWYRMELTLYPSDNQVEACLYDESNIELACDSDVPYSGVSDYSYLNIYNYVKQTSNVDLAPYNFRRSESVEPDFCDYRGLKNECVMNETNQLNAQQYNVSSFFDVRESAVFESFNGQASLNISNTSTISGLWEGSFHIRTENPKIKSGAEFRPQDGTIIIED